MSRHSICSSLKSTESITFDLSNRNLITPLLIITARPPTTPPSTPQASIIVSQLFQNPTELNDPITRGTMLCQPRKFSIGPAKYRFLRSHSASPNRYTHLQHVLFLRGLPQHHHHVSIQVGKFVKQGSWIPPACSVTDGYVHPPRGVPESSLGSPPISSSRLSPCGGSSLT